MTIPQVSLSNSFNEWRVITNTLSTNLGDLATIYDVSKTSLILAVNDLETRKFNKAGGTISGASTFSSTLGINGAATLGSTLAVTGDVAVNSTKFNVTASSGNTTIAGTLGVTGTSTLAGLGCTTLNASGATTLSSTANVVGNFSVNTSWFTVNATNGNTQVGGTFGSTGAATLSSTLAVTGDVAVNSTKFNVTASSGNTTIAGTLGVTLATTLNNTLNLVGGTVTTNTPLISGSQTWNNGGVSFDAIKLDITNTASSGSHIINSRLWNGSAFTTRFSVDASGTIFQYVTTNYLARDIVAKDLNTYPTAPHIREYQDLDDGLAGGTQGLDPYSVSEWGYTYNAKWNGSSYIKDRSNALDHASYSRFTEDHKQQLWFSDGTTPGSAIAWVKKINFDLLQSTYTFDGSIYVGLLNTSSLITTSSVTVGSVTSLADYEVTTTTTSPTTLATIDATIFRSATFEVQAYDATSGKYHKTLISAIHNGTVADYVEYGAVAVSGVCGAYTVSKSGNALLLQTTSVSTNSTVYKIHSRLMKI